MSSATTQAQAAPDQLELFRVRDDIARHYGPADALELMLVTQIAQAWLCLQHAYEAQRRYFAANDVLEAIATQFDQYKAITREVTNCERAWRHALLHLEKTQRQRQRGGLPPSNARRSSIIARPRMPAPVRSMPPYEPAHPFAPTPSVPTPLPAARTG